LNRLTRFFCLLIGLAWPFCAVHADILLRQADGSELVLEQAAQRLVTLSPNLAELVYAAGAGDHLLATVEYSEYPDAAADLPRIGDAFRLDIEGISALQPDLVIAWDSGNPKAAVRQLRALGIAVWAVEIRRPEQIGDTLLDMGRATSSEAIAGQAAFEFKHRLDRLSARYDSVTALDYFYQVDARPLFTINGEHLISKGLALCGGRNVFASEPGLAFQVGHEAVIVADPDALLAPALPGDADPLETWREWPGMKAVKDGALFTLNANKISQATPRWLDSIESACRQLHGLRAQSLNP
jgi:iron complex transport system substrate-binding protein